MGHRRAAYLDVDERNRPLGVSKEFIALPSGVGYRGIRISRNDLPVLGISMTGYKTRTKGIRSSSPWPLVISSTDSDLPCRALLSLSYLASVSILAGIFIALVHGSTICKPLRAEVSVDLDPRFRRRFGWVPFLDGLLSRKYVSKERNLSSPSTWDSKRAGIIRDLHRSPLSASVSSEGSAALWLGAQVNPHVLDRTGATTNLFISLGRLVRPSTAHHAPFRRPPRRHVRLLRAPLQRIVGLGRRHPPFLVQRPR